MSIFFFLRDFPSPLAFIELLDTQNPEKWQFYIQPYKEHFRGSLLASLQVCTGNAAQRTDWLQEEEEFTEKFPRFQ
jgi:hypothetical protein